MSVDAVELTARGEDAPRVIGFLAAGVPQVRVVAATQTRVVSMNATYDGDEFVMAGGTIGGDTVTAMTGPAWQLPQELARLLAVLGEASSVPAVPRFATRSVAVPDALVLAEDIRAGGIDDLLTALRVAHLDRVPAWLSDLAHGVSAAFLVLVSDERSTRLGTHLVGLPSGWGHLQGTDDELSMRPVDLSEIRAELAEICLTAAALVKPERS
ncbi:hypothetical protein [Allobranchiibius sp. CTAmp26]|uniref:hypothetical protein n=1 Tax=Allobranchiibius sp. CTAmp26 TaxID=2815214 RepID=UPI001AA13E5B|nr:hypothetical protein [Allobranchiibius sp. CTAmp26]MBO1754764.1 hypothetical protein [Allobranchiibius sp. CTAmp26]